MLINFSFYSKQEYNCIIKAAIWNKIRSKWHHFAAVSQKFKGFLASKGSFSNENQVEWLKKIRRCEHYFKTFRKEFLRK